MYNAIAGHIEQRKTFQNSLEHTGILQQIIIMCIIFSYLYGITLPYSDTS